MFQTPTEAIYGGVPGFAILYLLLLIALVIFGLRARHLYVLLRTGRAENRNDNIGKRTRAALSALAGVRVLRGVSRKDRAGIGHFVLAWTFIIFFVNYAYLFIWGAWHEHLSLLTLGNTFSSGFSNILDILALLTLVAIIWAVGRRYIIKPERLEAGFDAAIILALVFLLMITHFWGEALSISMTEGASGGIISTIFASVFGNLSANTQKTAHYGIWWFHMVILLGFLVYIPYSKHLHLLAAPFNVFFKSLGPKGALKPIDLETEETLGIDKIEGFTWKQLLDLYACAKCGRCEVSCPAYLSGKPLSPKELIEDLRVELLRMKGQGDDEAKHELIGDVISEDAIWACTTCRACQEECPVCNEHIDKIIDMRRNLALERNKVPEVTQRALESLMLRGDPWTGVLYSRAYWLKELEVKKLYDDSDVDILYWVGCTAALDERNMKVAIAVTKLLKEAGVKFGVLAEEETCCGDPARRIGQELLFQTQAQRNIETFKRYNVKKIVTACPHCFNIIKNEYPQLGGDFKVVHHTEFIARLIEEDKLKLTKDMNKILTYHDPCYLGRYNDIYEVPREILKLVPGSETKEIESSKEKSFCCGGGGGHMWMEEAVGTKINAMRTEDVIKTEADVVITACPFCLQMFEEGISRKNLDKAIQAMDIAEIVEKVI